MGGSDWDPRALPDLSGRRYLVTGSNAGLGFFACLQLAQAGAHVVMTARNPNRLAAARAALARLLPNASTEPLILDTSNLGSVRAAAATARSHQGLHGVLLNAGIVHPPKQRQVTSQGHELVFATSALGHYALAGELLLSLAAARGRLVWRGSLSMTVSPMEVIDPELENGYTPWRAYVQSKIATASLGFEADRRLREARVPVASVVAHPGYSIGGRTRGIPGVNAPSKTKRFVDNLLTPLTQSKEHGAWPLVRALVDPDVEGGQYWGPSRGLHGQPHEARVPGAARDLDQAARLWHYCEHATGMAWPYLQARKGRRR